MPPSQLLMARARESMVSRSRWFVGSSCTATDTIEGNSTPLAHSHCPTECMQVITYESQGLGALLNHKCCHRGL